jgi:hypothetical protein
VLDECCSVFFVLVSFVLLFMVPDLECPFLNGATMVTPHRLLISGGVS